MSTPLQQPSTLSNWLIGGAGHSGSTLLGLMLGSLPDVFYAGEAKKASFLGDLNKPEKKRVCKVCGLRCVIWNAAEIRGAHNPDALYSVLREVTHARIVCDSSKDIAWQHAQISYANARGERVQYIWLIRDGRGVVNSRMRKYPTISVDEHTRDWLAQMRAVQALTDELHVQRGDAVSVVGYENIARNPRRELAILCTKLGVVFDESALEFWRRPHHPLGGNNGTQAALQAPSQGKIALDERWRTEMPKSAQERFRDIAGTYQDQLERLIQTHGNA